MNYSFFPPVRAALLGTALVGLTATAPSATQLQSGVLECDVAPGVVFIIGSSKSLSCVFHPARGRPEYYAGTISRVGVDIGATGPGQFAWGVYTAGPPGRRYALAGDYAGPGAGFALGAGPRGDALVGGYGNMVSLEGRVDRRQSVHGYRRPKLAASRSGTAAAPPPPWLSRISSGTIGLPPRHRDFHRQNNFDPLLCPVEPLISAYDGHQGPRPWKLLPRV